MLRSKIYLTTLIIVSIFISQLLNPIMVRADGETDPQPTETGEVTTPPEPTDVVIDLVETESVEATSTPDPTQLMLEPAETDTPVVSEEDATDPTTENVVEPVSETVLEVLEGLPAETSIIVLDETGQVEPLATEAAAEAILIGDPVWCPGIQAPTPGSNGCSASFASLSDLVAGFIPTANGTIWIQTGNDNGLAVTIDGSAGWAAASSFSLTLQGGWSGTSGDTTIGSNSVFDTQILISNWNNTITFNNITMDSVAASALRLNNVQDVNINNSEFLDNNNHGMWVFSANNVSISGSTFSGNNSSGTSLNYINNLTISNSIFSGNDYAGAYLWDANGNVSISNSRFIDNGTSGAAITDPSDDVYISDSIFSGNDSGTFIQAAGNVFVSNSTFDNNNIGAEIWSSDSVSISNNIFNNNSWGADLENNRNVSILTSMFTGNTYGAVFLDNSAYIANSTFQDNGVSAIYFENSGHYSGSVFHLTLECNNYLNNPSNLEMVGDVTLTEILCEHAPRKPVGPIIIVITVPSDADHIEFEMECFDSEIYRVEWANGDKMELSCVPEARVRISRLDNTDLTKDLPAGFGYMTSYNIELFQNGTPVEMMPSNGSVQLSFADKDEGAQYGIMYWNEKTSNWIVLNEFQQNTNGTSVVFPLNASDPMDGYKILRGVQHIETQNPHREQVATNFTGIFVLVQR